MSVLNPNIPDGSQPLGVFKLSGSIDVSAQLLAPPPDPGQRPEHCSVCNNVGYLLGQTYGTAEIPEGWTPVQACDTCMAFSTDGLAAWSAKLALQAAGVAYFPSAIDDDVVVAFGGMVGEGSEGQGEWAILWTLDQPADLDAPSLPSAGVSDAEIAHTLELLAAALPRTIDSMRIRRGAKRLLERSAQLNRTGWTLAQALGLVADGATAADLPDAETLAKLLRERLDSWTFDLTMNGPDPTMAIARRPFHSGFADPRPTFTLVLTCPHDVLGAWADGLRRTGSVRLTLTEARQISIDARPDHNAELNSVGRWNVTLP